MNKFIFDGLDIHLAYPLGGGIVAGLCSLAIIKGQIFNEDGEAASPIYGWIGVGIALSLLAVGIVQSIRRVKSK